MYVGSTLDYYLVGAEWHQPIETAFNHEKTPSRTHNPLLMTRSHESSLRAELAGSVNALPFRRSNFFATIIACKTMTNDDMTRHERACEPRRFCCRSYHNAIKYRFAPWEYNAEGTADYMIIIKKCEKK